ncbi:MAG: RNA methyltransferase [Anaerolineales bacterium]|nr:RNA methyltransferase [Anaerolineales bacterium]
MITSAHNPTVKRVTSLQTQRKAREAEGQFIIEGPRLAEEALRARANVELVLYTLNLDERSRMAVGQLERLGARAEGVSETVMAAISDTETPAGLLAIVAMPTFLILPHPGFALVLDRISDPGNLGTLLRTAEAAGVQAVFLMPGTVDAFNPKVVRAAMGAHFRIPVAEARWETLAGQLGGAAVWLAEARAGQDYATVDWQGPSALIVGSEAEGPSAAARAFTRQTVHIPMPGRAESLNVAVAAGILLFAAARQRQAAA